jgi:ATP/maltotriose-dependent transcriptional regulator MalT
VLALNVLGLVLRSRLDYAGADLVTQEALSLARELGDAWAIAQTLDNLGVVAWRDGDLARGTSLHEESLAVAREAGDSRHIALALENLAHIASRQGDWRRSTRLFAESLVEFRIVRDPRRLGMVFAHLGQVMLTHGSQVEAAGLLGAAHAISDIVGMEYLGPEWLPDYRRARASVRTRLGAAAFDAAWAAGRALTLEEATDYALRMAAALASDAAAPDRAGNEPERTVRGLRVAPLSVRETEVAALIARGSMNRDIGDQLVISERTVETHISNIRSKLGLTARTQIAAWAVEQGLLAGSR